jgi:hypothetical protein
VSEPAKIDGLALSGFALHAERLLKQYADLTREHRPAERYEATLTLSVLQFLLTNCWELYKLLNDRKAARKLAALHDYMGALLLEPDVSVTKEFRGETVDPKAIIKHLRNALSHPMVNISTLPTTGYTTIEDGSGLVVRMKFTDSPNVTSKGALRDVSNEGDIEVFEIELPLSRVTALAERVAHALAQPTLENWDKRGLLLIPIE